jgi:hypothetical protein
MRIVPTKTGRRIDTHEQPGCTSPDVGAPVNDRKLRLMTLGQSVNDPPAALNPPVSWSA